MIQCATIHSNNEFQHNMMQLCLQVTPYFRFVNKHFTVATL